MKNLIPSVLCLVGTCAIATAQQGPAGLWVADLNGTIQPLDETLPAVFSNLSAPLSNVAEIEYTGSTFLASRGFGDMEVVDATSGASLGSLTLDTGATNTGAVSLTALEYDGTTMYGSISNPGGIASELVTIDLNTGAATGIGVTGIGGPLGGLAYDGTTMYAIEAGGAFTNLYSIDLNTGAATPVAPVGLQLSGLEFGLDGQLYATGVAAQDQLLYTINTTTGVPTLLGAMENTNSPRAITSAFIVPAPATVPMLGLLGLVATRRRR